MKRKIVLMSIAGALVMSAMIGGTLAGFNTQSGQGRTDITTKALGIELTGESAFGNGGRTVTETCLPGTEITAPYFVTNNVKEGYELYTRVTIYKYWEDNENGELQPENIHLYTKTADGGKTELLPGTEAAVRVNDWFVQYADGEQVILYYAKPLSSGEATGNVLDSLTVDEEAGNAYTGRRIVLEIQADAVQKAAAEASIPSEWGVYPSFDEAGNITAIAE